MQLDPQAISQKRKMQMDILFKESDLKKNERLKSELEISIRELKLKESQIRSEMILKEIQLKKIEEAHMQLYNEIIKLKHQMNTFGHR
jgi:hypothetical protein